MSWLSLLAEMRLTLSVEATSSTLAGEDPKNATPAPGKVILEVEATASTRSALPASRATSWMFSSSSPSSKRSCTT